VFVSPQPVEEGDVGEFAVSMEPGAGSVALDITLVPVTAGPEDVTVAQYSVDLGPESWGITLQVATTEDTLDEPDETFRIVVDVVSGAASGHGEALMTITDDDAPVVLPGPGTPGPVVLPGTLERACPSPVRAGFHDVSDKSVHADAIGCLVQLGLGRGTGGTTFSPGSTLSRGQLASFLDRLVDRVGDVPAAAPDAFPDDEGDVHEGAIDRMAALGIVTGRADGTFGAGEPVLRGQMASFLVRTYRILVGTDLPAGTDRFADDTGDVHEAAIDAAARSGLVAGTSTTTFSPGTAVQRDQMASFLVRLLDLL
jgi:hypothetical protein